MENHDDQPWTPPPPPEDQIFSAETREYYAKEIGTRARNSLIFGILSLLCCGLIFGFLGYAAGNDAINTIDTYGVGLEKRGMAQTGRTLSVIGLVVWLASLVLLIVFRPVNFGR